MTLSTNAQAALNKVVARFQAGDLSPIVEIVRIRLAPDAPARRWTFANQVLAYAQTGALDCRGFRQWKDAGRSVKKGARAAYILRPRTIRKEGEGEGAEPQTVCIGFAGLAVFPLEATEGEELPSYAPATLPPLHDVALRLGIAVEWTPTPPTVAGSYSPSQDRIRVGTHDEAVWFHELAHAAHKRVQGHLQGGQDPKQETVAELAAAVLMELYGLRDHTGDAWQYIAGYNADPLVAICQAVGEVGQILAVLLEPEVLA